MWRVAVLTILVLLMGCEDKREKAAKRLYDAGIEYSKNNEYEKALELLQRVRVEYSETKTAEQAEGQIDSIQGLQNMLMQNQKSRISQKFTRIALGIENYKRRYRSYPLTVEDLKKLNSDLVPEFADDDGNPIFYKAYSSPGVSPMEPDNFVLGCFGADGIPGGKGKHMDFFYQNRKEVAQIVLP